MKRVLVTSSEYAAGIREAVQSVIDSYDYEVIFHNGRGPMKEQEIIEEINEKECEGLLVYLSKDEVTEKVIDSCPGLKVISRHGVGLDNIAAAYAREKGIQVVNTGNSKDYEAVADLCFAYILDLARNIRSFDRDLKQGIWDRSVLQHNVTGSTLGIIGFGRIGQAVARRALGFGMRVLVCHTRKAPDGNNQEKGEEQSFAGGSVRIVSKEELLQESDYVTLQCVVTPETTGLIGEEEFAMMKHEACLINTGRAALVDQQALLKALKERTIRAAAVDVFTVEPTTQDPLMTSGLNNLIVTPHIGIFTEETLREIDMLAMDNMLSALQKLDNSDRDVPDKRYKITGPAGKDTPVFF